MKRVICLYRVSTVGQVDHDDIPMQKIACREYAATHQDWEIIDEISEKGVSGYKVSTNARDAIFIPIYPVFFENVLSDFRSGVLPWILEQREVQYALSEQANQNPHAEDEIR